MGKSEDFMLTLKQLEAYFIKYQKAIAGEGHGRLMPDGTYQWGGFEIDTMIPVDHLSEAQGITFLCPKCFAENNGAEGAHSILISFEGRGVLPEQGSHAKDGSPSRWNIIGGTGLDDLQLSPSILIDAGHCQWHGFVGNSGVSPGCAQ